MDLASALSARDNPSASQIFHTMAASSALTKANGLTFQKTDPAGKNYLFTDAKGNVVTRPIPVGSQEPPDKEKVPAPNFHDTQQFQDANKVLLSAQQNIDKATDLQEALQKGNMNTTWDARLGAFIDNTSGHSTENSRYVKDLNALVNQYIINVASQEKGPMTKAKMDNARLSVMPSGAENDPVTVYSALERMKQVQQANFDASSGTLGAKLGMFPQLGTSTQVNGKPVQIADFIKQKSDEWATRQDKLQSGYAEWVNKHDNPGGASSGLPKVNSVADAMKLPPGTHFIDPTGKERVR